MSTISGRGDAPFSSSWLGHSSKKKIRKYSIYPPSMRGDDGSMRDAMVDFFFEPVATVVPYRLLRGPRLLTRGSRPVRGPRVYNGI